MARLIFSLLSLLVCDLVHLDITPVAAINIPVRGHIRPSRRRSLSRRATNTSVHVTDVSNTEYLADITMGGYVTSYSVAVKVTHPYLFLIDNHLLSLLILEGMCFFIIFTYCTLLTLLVIALIFG